MKANAVRIGVIFLVSQLLFSCSQDSDSGYYNNPATYTESNTVRCTEVILLIAPYTNDGGAKKFVVANQISNLNISINGSAIAPMPSYIVDTLHLRNKTTVNGFRVSDDMVQFAVEANVTTTTGNPETAGDYASMLNNRLTLDPGSYIFQIVSFDIMQANGTLKTVYPNITTSLEIKENYSSGYAGTFEVSVD